MEETFLTYKKNRWLWFGVISAVLLSLSYPWYSNPTLPHGGTFMGLLYGVLGTILIVILMALGIRKRRLGSRLGTVQGWTSAHVYLGLLTLLIIPMHAGFRFHFDFHTLAFALLALVVLSGILGVVLYSLIPSRLTKYEETLQGDKIDQEINRILGQMRNVVRNKSDALVDIYKEELHQTAQRPHSGWRVLWRRHGDGIISNKRKSLSEGSAKVPLEGKEDFLVLSGLILQKAQLEKNFFKQMRLKNALSVWLYVHVPLSVSMLFAIMIHLVSVFYY